MAPDLTGFPSPSVDCWINERIHWNEATECNWLRISCSAHWGQWFKSTTTCWKDSLLASIRKKSRYYFVSAWESNRYRRGDAKLGKINLMTLNVRGHLGSRVFQLPISSPLPVPPPPLSASSFSGRAVSDQTAPIAHPHPPNPLVPKLEGSIFC